MHNNIMAAGSRDRPPMLATGRYAQWRSRFLRYIDTRPNGDALRKCILIGPYTPTIVTTPVVPATEDSPLVPEQTTVETVMNMTPENRAHFESEKEAIHLILTGIGDEIYSTVDDVRQLKKYGNHRKGYNKVATMQVNVQFLQQLQPEWSRFVTIVKQQHKLDEVSYHKLFDILKQYQKEVNELRAERMAKNANPLALVATAQTLQDPYYQTSKPHKSYAPTSKASLPTRSHATTRYKGKEIAKPITPPSESASEEDSDPEQAQKDKDMQKNLALIAKYFKKLYKPTNNNLRTSSNTRNKNVDTTPRYKNDNQTGQFRNQRAVNVVGARETVGGQVVQQSGIQCFNCKEFGHYAKECRKPKRSTLPVLADTDEEIDGTRVRKHIQLHTWQKFREVPMQTQATDTKAIGTDLKYVESLEDEIDELESDKAEFSNMYDMLLQECVSKDVMCSYLQSSSDLDEITELQCLYLHKVRECDCLAQKLSEQTEFVNLKAQLQDKNIAISELKKLIEKCKGKYVDTKFDKPSVVRQPNAQRIPKPSVLGKPAPFSDSLERKYFAKKKSVLKTNESEGLSKPVTPQNLPQTATQAVRNTNVIKPGMYRIASSTTQTRAPQLNQTSRNTNPRISTSTGVAHKTNVSRPQPRSNQMKGKVVPNTSHVGGGKRLLYKKTSKAWKWWIAQQCPSAYKWVPKTTMKWVPKVRNETVPKRVSYAIDTIVQLILFIVDSGCTKHMTGNLSLLCNFVEKYLGTVHFGNDQFAPILGYGDLVQGNITIKRVYYVEEIFREKNDLQPYPFGTDLYTISLQETTSSTPICLMAKASPTQAWLWHRRLSHLNFDYINLLSKKDVVIGLPKLKNLQAPVISVRTDRGTEFLNKTLHAFFKEEGIEHQTSTPRTPEQNGVVERRNRTLVEAARTMLSASKLPLFFWAEAIATACYTQNRSIIIPTHEKTAYHIINDRKPSIKHLHIFGCTCYLTRDGENLDKMKEKGDSCLCGYTTSVKGISCLQQENKASFPNDKSVNKSNLPPTDHFLLHIDNTNPSMNIHPTTEPSTPTHVNAEENNNDQAEFTNPFCTPVQEIAESSSRNIGTSNMHTFNQPQDSEYRWTKDHPLTQVRGNPSKPVQTR
ncbi:retrovirus-related pol polyprotein from transposon TNT 1-94 [Tanacetum coccineum]|uniref:Retrovirus-related pol polyprotein from transposon TNT 1-94 n=1 Tax=Tanacetum coccineum TaxID=301880 RepID=A0ABQ5ICP2_9ASTR